MLHGHEPTKLDNDDFFGWVIDGHVEPLDPPPKKTLPPPTKIVEAFSIDALPPPPPCKIPSRSPHNMGLLTEKLHEAGIKPTTYPADEPEM